jgi:hypothetical protein
VEARAADENDWLASAPSRVIEKFEKVTRSIVTGLFFATVHPGLRENPYWGPWWCQGFGHSSGNCWAPNSWPMTIVAWPDKAKIESERKMRDENKDK